MRAVASGVLRFGDVEVPCYVLEDGRPVLSEKGVLRGITGKSDGAEVANLGRYLDRIPGDNRHLASVPTIDFTLPDGGRAKGREAEWFVDFCNAYSDAYGDRLLHPSQEHIGRQCRTIVKACAKIGIRALVHDACGYQAPSGEYTTAFDRMLRESPTEWSERWPKHVVEAFASVYGFRVLDGKFPVGLCNPIGKLYRSMMGSGAYIELRQRNGRCDGRRPKTLHHQYFTDDMHKVTSDTQVIIVALARIHQGDPDGFWRALAKALDSEAEAEALRREVEVDPRQMSFLERLFGRRDS